MECRYCDKNPSAKEICGSCQEFYKEDRFGQSIEAQKEGVKAGFRSMKELVRHVLKESARARNEDSWLILKCLEARGVLIVQKDENLKEEAVLIPYSSISEIGSFETIRRVRQEIQNTDGDFLPTDPAVLVKRRIREEAIREYYADNPEKLQEYQETAYGVQ